MTIDSLTRREFLGLGIVTGISLAVPELVFGGGQELTPTQKENLKEYGYAWDEVYIKNSDLKGRHFPYKCSKDNWKDLFFNNSYIQNMFKEPNRMRELMKSLTDNKIPNGELRAVFISNDNRLTYSIQTSNNPHADNQGNFIGFYSGAERFTKQEIERLIPYFNRPR